MTLIMKPFLASASKHLIKMKPFFKTNTSFCAVLNIYETARDMKSS